jgi:peptidoglycan/LPS O-acetylase OafA/YrhL
MIHESRIPSLDGLRGIAALAVMAFHFNVFFLPQARLPFVSRGYLAVDLFFLISGFVMAHTYGEQLGDNRQAHWFRFALARFARIYPLFVLTTLAMIAIQALSGMHLDLVSFSNRALLLQPFLLQQWMGLSWNYPSWSISTEAEAYIFFIFAAGIIVTGKHPGLMRLACALVLLALCIVKGESLNLYSGSSALARTLAEFSFGALLYRAHSDQDGLDRGWVVVLGILLSWLAAETGFDLSIVGAFACLIYYFVNSTEGILNSRAAVALGNWSYSIYLWHAPTHYGVMAALGACGHPVADLDKWSARLLAMVTALMVVALAAISYRYFETRARNSLKGLAAGSLHPRMA